MTVEEVKGLIRAKTPVVFLDSESPTVWDAKDGAALRIAHNVISPFLRSLAKDANIVVYTSAPNVDSSALVVNAFKQQKFTNVKPLHGGSASWQQLAFSDADHHVFPSHW